MSTSLLYHAFGIRAYLYVRTSFAGGGVRFDIERPRERLRCGNCGSPRVILRGSKERAFRGLPIGRKPVTVVLKQQRVECRQCHAIHWDKADFADGKRRYTRSFGRYVIELSLHMSMSAVAKHLDAGWDLVKELKAEYLKRHYDPPKLGNLTRFAIDEIAVGKGHRYMTIVLDLMTGRIVYTGEGKGADALTDFWPRLKRSGARIEAVAMDMSPAYISAVRTNLPESMIVFDRFHVVKLMNEKLSVLRRDIHRELQDKAQKDVLKGSRWLLLKNPENLNMERDEWDHLQEILTANQPLALGYYMKEELRLFWEQPDREAAVEMLEGWLARARASKVKILVGLADTLERHWDGLLAWYDCPIGTGKLEGVNNKIRALTRQAYGFRDQEFFRLQLFGLHETRTELVGVAA